MSARAIVHLVDDDASFLKATSRLLKASGFEVECFASAHDFFERRRPGASGCVLADLDMPGLGGLDLQAALAASDNPMPVVFLTAHGDIPSTVRAMKQGAEDFITKQSPKEQLVSAIVRALGRDVGERADRARKQTLHQRLQRLSPREREVLLLVVQGKPNKEIACDLGIHERTVKLHRTAITTKLDVGSVAELTRFAQDAGILP